MAWLQDEEPAATLFQALLEKAQRRESELVLSAINAGEIYYLLAKRCGPQVAAGFRKRLPAMPVRLDVPTEQDIWAAADLKSQYPLSYADAFAAALALSGDCALLTGDPEFEQIAELKVRWLR